MSRVQQWLLALIVLAIVGIGLWQNSVKWLFLCEVQWIAALFLFAFPILARTTNRALILGAYEIETWSQGFLIALLLTFASASIVWTGEIELTLAEARLHEPIGDPFFPKTFGLLLLVGGLGLNLFVTHEVSNPPNVDGRKASSWHATDSGMLVGVLAGIGCFIVGQLIMWKVELVLSSPLFSDAFSAIESALKGLPPQFRDGYIGRDGHDLAAESKHISALTLLVVSGMPYLIFRERVMPPLCSIALLTIFLVWLLSGFAFFFQVFRIPTLIPLLVWLWLSARHPKADHFYKVSNNPVPASLSGAKFLESSDPEGRLLVVAAAGGGIQAAAWTAKVLAELKTKFDNEKPGPFQNSLRAVSGVSGGSVGLMYYLACQASGSPAMVAAGAAAKSSLSEVVRALAYDDLFRAFFPFFTKDIYRDRGNALMEAWLKNGSHTGGGDYKNALKSATLRQWGTAVAEGKLPAVILNSTIVEKGQRLAFSTVPLHTSLGFEGFCEFTTLYPQYDIPLSTAARLSASFTFVSPGARPAVPEREKELRKIFSAPVPANDSDNLHLVDGGYLDNTGITALVQMLHQKLTELHDTFPKKMPKKILVLLINAFPLPPEQYVKSHRGTFFQLWAPLLTLLTVRGVAHDAMAQSQLSLLKEALGTLHGIELGWIDFRFSEALQRGGNKKAAQDPPPLSWHLTRAQKSAINNAWTHMTPEIKQVRAFLEGGVMPQPNDSSCETADDLALESSSGKPR